jgi:hypothetical protein
MLVLELELISFFFFPFFKKKEIFFFEKKNKMKNFILFSIIFLSFISLNLANQLPVTKIPIRHNSYINVLIGNPGKYTLLKIEYAINETLILFNEPFQTSKTFSLYPPSVLVYLGEHVLRLSTSFEHFRYIKYPTLRRDCEGIISVGPYSELWVHWHKATLSRTMMVLGEYDYSLTRHSFDPYQIVFDNTNPVYMMIDEDGSKNITVSLNLQDKHTTIPNEIFHNPTEHFLKFKDKHKIAFTREDLEYITEDHVIFPLFFKNNNNSFVMGSEFLTNFVVMFNIVENVYKLHPPFSAFDLGNSEPIYTYTFLIMLAPLFIYYHISVNIFNLISSRKYFVLEVAAYAIALMALGIETVGYRADRIFLFRMNSSGNFYFIFYCIIMLLTCVVGLVLSWKYARKRKELNTRKVFFETAVLGIVWLNQIRFTANDPNNITVVLIALILTINRMIQFLFVLFYAPQKRMLLFICFVYVTLSVLFLFLYNFNIILNYNFYGFDGHLDSLLLMFELFALLPAITIFLQADIAILLEH